MMFSTQGSIASRCDFDFFASDLVVVGRVPMNQKRGKRQLERIAKAQDVAPPPSQDRKGRKGRNPRPEGQLPNQRNQGRASQPKQERKTQDRKTPAPERSAPRPRALLDSQPKPVAARITVGRSGALVRVVELPAETLVHVAGFTGLSALGALAATGRSAHASLWGPSSALLWAGLGAGRGATWDTFRIQHFGLGAGWLAELAALCAAEPLPGLERACRLSLALLPADRMAAAFLPVLATAARGAPCGPALALLDALLPKLRTEVFASRGALTSARDELQERQILADIDLLQQRDHEALAFDYFDAPPALPPPPPFWDELESLDYFGAAEPKADYFSDDFAHEVEEPAAPEPAAPEPAAIPEAASRLLAAEFLEALGARHGFAWQDTVAAMAAVER